MSLRVAIDATSLLGNPTGVGVFCRNLLASLSARDDVSVSAFAVSWRRRHGLIETLPREVVWNQRALPARPLHWSWRHFDGPAIDWFIGRQDIVHGTNFVVPPVRRGGSLVTVHDLTVVRYPELCDRATLVFPTMIQKALSRGAWIHTPSEFVASEVVELLGADPARVRAVHSGTPAPPPPETPQDQGPEGTSHRDDEALQPGAMPPERMPQEAMPLEATPVPGLPDLPPGTERFVLAIGTAEPRKDFPGLVRAFEKVAESRKDLALVLAGPEGWGSEELRETISASPMRRQMIQTGWLDDRTLFALLGRASLLCFPSLYEGFGFPPLQAMAAGIPVVATRAGALPEVLGSAAELVPPRDETALAGALARVLDDEQHRRQLILKGRERARAFTWERCAAGMVALYLDLAHERGSR